MMITLIELHVIISFLTVTKIVGDENRMTLLQYQRLGVYCRACNMKGICNRDGTCDHCIDIKYFKLPTCGKEVDNCAHTSCNGLRANSSNCQTSFGQAHCRCDDLDSYTEHCNYLGSLQNYCTRIYIIMHFKAV